MPAGARGERSSAEIDEALPRHKIWGMYLAQFQDPKGEALVPPTARDMALVGTPDGVVTLEP